jgi:hypothetical protein
MWRGVLAQKVFSTAWRNGTIENGRLVIWFNTNQCDVGMKQIKSNGQAGLGVNLHQSAPF